MGMILGVADQLRVEVKESLKRRRSSGQLKSGKAVDAAAEGDGAADNSANSSASNAIKAGQHIFSCRRWGSYSHHGIYINDDKVIHFTRTEDKEAYVPSWTGVRCHSNHTPCRKCSSHTTSQGDDHQLQVAAVVPRGVIQSCLECFCRDGSKLQPVHLYAYGLPRWRLLLKVPGSGTATAAMRSPIQVIETAQMLLANQSFGKYNLLRNNCEHFATFCCTETCISEQTALWAWLAKKLSLPEGIFHRPRMAVTSEPNYCSLTYSKVAHLSPKLEKNYSKGLF